MRKLIFAEIIFAFISVQALNSFFWADQLGFPNTHPHPYWVLIFIFAIAYGAIPGTFTGIVASIFYIFNPTLTSGSSDIQKILADTSWVFPFLFIFSGFLMGEAIQGYRKSLDENERVRKETEQKLENLNERYETDQEILRKLEKKIASQFDSMTTLYDLSKKLNVFNTNKIF